MNAIKKYVTETSEEIPIPSVENRGTGKLAQAKPRPKTTLTLSLVSIPDRARKWMDVEPGNSVKVEVSKFMIRWLRHYDTVHREDDGAVRFDYLA